MSPQRYDKIVDAVAGVVGSQYDGFILPIVFLRVSVAAVLADLKQQKGSSASVSHHRRTCKRETRPKREKSKRYEKVCGEREVKISLGEKKEKLERRKVAVRT